jgi:tetratricopeptide (TPR) repeat protein
VRQDARGLEVSTDDDAVIAEVDLFRDQMICLGPLIAEVLGAADAHAQSVMLQTLAATVGLYGQDRAGAQLAERYLARAAQAGEANERESLFLEATRAGARGDVEGAADRLEAITARWPRDLLAAKVCEFHYYQMGQHWTAARFLSHMERIAAANADVSHFLAMRAFAHELAGARPRAIELARRALDLEPQTPWAHHALAHALIRDGRPAEGLAAVGGYLESWSRCSRAIESHNSWHLALFHWMELDFAPAWALYRAHIWNPGRETTGELLDMISFLWRLELAGEPVPAADWQAVAGRVLPHVGEYAIPFNVAHYAYALGRAGRDEEIGRLQEAARAFATRQTDERAKAWRDVGLPLIDASIAAARGDAATACARLAPVVAEIGRVGGSDAQDDLFRHAHLVALLDAGEQSAARAALREMLAGRAPTPLEESWLLQL